MFGILAETFRVALRQDRRIVEGEVRQGGPAPGTDIDARRRQMRIVDRQGRRPGDI